jgi:hypothetical protein
MKILLKNKKGAEKILAIYWFAILVLVSAGIFSIVYSFQNPYDVRGLEASILTGKVASCLAPQGILDSKILENIGSSSIDDVADKATLDELIKASSESPSCNCGENCETYSELVLKYSEENGIFDPLLLIALMSQESLCVSTADSGSSVGLMQINLGKWCGKLGLPADKETCKNELINNPETNIRVGSEILKESYNDVKKRFPNGRQFSGACTEEYKQKIYYGWEAALRGYNGWGCGVFQKGHPQEGEKIISQDYYVDNVLKRYNDLRKIIGKEPVLKEIQIDFSGICNLNLGENETQSPEYYLEVNFFNFTSGSFLNLARTGNLNLKSDCIVQKADEYGTLSKCVERSLYSVDKDNQQYLIKILSAVRKTEQNTR